jgi:hypothetical protein
MLSTRKIFKYLLKENKKHIMNLKTELLSAGDSVGAMLLLLLPSLLRPHHVTVADVMHASATTGDGKVMETRYIHSVLTYITYSLLIHP